MFSHVKVSSSSRNIDLAMGGNHTAELDYASTDEGVRMATLSVFRNAADGQHLVHRVSLDHAVIKDVSAHEIYLIGYSHADEVTPHTEHMGPGWARTKPEYASMRLRYYSPAVTSSGIDVPDRP